MLFLDALASLKTKLVIKSLMFSRLQDFKSFTGCYRVLQSLTECNRVLQSVREYYRVLQSLIEYYRVLKGVTECYIVLHSITECYKVSQSISSASTWTNFWACFFSFSSSCFDNFIFAFIFTLFVLSKFVFISILFCKTKILGSF